MCFPELDFLNLNQNGFSLGECHLTRVSDLDLGPGNFVTGDLESRPLHVGETVPKPALEVFLEQEPEDFFVGRTGARCLPFPGFPLAVRSWESRAAALVVQCPSKSEVVVLDS